VRAAREGTQPDQRSQRTARGWIDSKSRGARDRALEREVFERVFGYRAALGVKVPRFTEDHDMMEAVINHIHEAWQPHEFRVWRRIDAEAGCAVEGPT